MTVLADKVVDWGQLLEVAWTSILGGVGVTAVFAVALYGAVKTMDTRRGGQGAIVVAYGVMTVLASSAVLASVVFAILTIKTK